MQSAIKRLIGLVIFFFGCVNSNLVGCTEGLFVWGGQAGTYLFLRNAPVRTCYGIITAHKPYLVAQ
jgi:hypothetical protein